MFLLRLTDYLEKRKEETDAMRQQKIPKYYCLSLTSHYYYK